MLSRNDILETIRMIDQQHLDIRTITMGISLLSCADSSAERACEKIYDKISRYAEHLVATGEEIEREFGIPIVNKRVSVTPIALVAAASETGRLVTNGMSEYARDKENINGGLLVNVTPADFGSSHPLAGIAFQRQLEEAAFRLGGGGYAAPCQRVEDFLAGRPSTGPGRGIPSYRPGVRWTDLRQCLPEFVWETLALALPMLDGKVRGYAQGDAVLTAVETRSSSPVRIIRDNSGQCNVRGLYPCGEGAGYAGGILSAAADGMRCAEKIWEVYNK